ncbi:uncharacterized protein LOC142339358 isoform X2 [Convolutriloba macropyga]|uniref:uncharacterized protein LOC142339358 isoform X2 n=1 Tax=Convolutriloba macropyga TaxID=536237 RepID=UPI003F51C4C2
MDNHNVRNSRSVSSRRPDHRDANTRNYTSSHHHFSSNQRSNRSSSSMAFESSSARFSSSAGIGLSDRSQIGSPTASFAAPSLSRLTIPYVNPHLHTNALHLACVNGDKQLLIKLVTSSDASGLNLHTSSRSVDRGNGSRASMRSMNINTYFTGAIPDVDTPDNIGRTPLMYCVLGNKFDCAEYLIKSTRANVNAADNLGRTALHWAAHKEHHKMLKLLISKGAADCRAKDRDGLTPFHLCMKNRSSKSTALIMKNLNANDLEEQDNYKRTALHLAAMYGSYDQVQMLLQRDANVGIPDGEGKTPLHWAINSKHQHSCSIVQCLVDHMPSVVNWQDHDGRTSLHLAVAEGSYNLVKTLIATDGCKLSCLDNQFRTPLHWAAVMDSPASAAAQIVTLLLHKDCDWTCSDSNGATPLHYAVQKNNAEIVRAFLEFPELVDQADIEGRSAFMWAAGAGALESLDLMVDHGADLSQSEKNGATALHAAATSGNVDCVKLLLRVGCKMTADNLKLTPLMRACELGHVAIAQLLIRHGAKITQQDREGRYPLHWACFGGNLRMCELLVVHGNVNCSDHMGRTPLQYAAQKGFNNCISLLIQHGADPNLQDAQGRTALHWSCSLGHLDVVRLLLKWEAFPNYMEFSEERYTPLDYALLNSHHEVAQYMIENAGALSINGIRDIAAAKIQAAFKGARERRSFVERRTLLLKHDKIRKNKSSSTGQQQHNNSAYSSLQNSEAEVLPLVRETFYSAPEDYSPNKSNMEAVDYSNPETQPQNEPRTSEAEQPVFSEAQNDVSEISTKESKGSLTGNSAAAKDKSKSNSSRSSSSRSSKSGHKIELAQFKNESQTDINQERPISKSSEIDQDGAGLSGSKQENVGTPNESTLSAKFENSMVGGQDPVKHSESGSLKIEWDKTTDMPYKQDDSKAEEVEQPAGIKYDDSSVHSLNVSESQEKSNDYESQGALPDTEHQTSEPKVTENLEGANDEEWEESRTLTRVKDETDVPPLSDQQNFADFFMNDAESEQGQNLQDKDTTEEPEKVTMRSEISSKTQKSSMRGTIKDSENFYPHSRSERTTPGHTSRAISETSSIRGQVRDEQDNSISEDRNQVAQSTPKPTHTQDVNEKGKRKVKSSNRERAQKVADSSSSTSAESHRSGSSMSIKSEDIVQRQEQGSEYGTRVEQEPETGEAEREKSITSEYRAMRAESVLPFNVTADEESQKSDARSQKSSKHSDTAGGLESRGPEKTATTDKNEGDEVTGELCSSTGGLGAGVQKDSVSAMLERQDHFRRIRLEEQQRRLEIQRRNNAAKLIQKAWRTYGFKSKKFYKAFKEVFLLRRSIGQEQSLKQEVAALTIQLAWRRYYRRKVLASNNPYRTMLNKFSRDVRNAKQNFVETRIYTRQQRAHQFYGMRVERPKRPYYANRIPYQSTLDYNFALQQYKPILYSQFETVAPRRERSARRFSYNLRT